MTRALQDHHMLQEKPAEASVLNLSYKIKYIWDWKNEVNKETKPPQDKTGF